MKKAKILTTADEEVQVEMDNKAVETVDSFVFLGSPIVGSGDSQR